ncbi:hypothetical protein [Xanthomonas bromi]|uniref:hypothetical protein n=1 Tax=Xanthomonas bromi TaxID=56449 RepID=UPI00215709E3|nr:hypothetical protein [Xanthomonas bromi]
MGRPRHRHRAISAAGAADRWRALRDHCSDETSDVYRNALQIAKSDAQVVQRLGTPITEDFLLNGSLSYSVLPARRISALGCRAGAVAAASR